MKLIDFDRAQSYSKYVQLGTSFMYTYEISEDEGRAAEHLDWKQLGLLLFILSRNAVKKHQGDLENKDIPNDIHCFLGNLIWNHQCANLDQWIESLSSDQKMSLVQVLSSH